MSLVGASSTEEQAKSVFSAVGNLLHENCAQTNQSALCVQNSRSGGGAGGGNAPCTADG